MLPVSPPPLPSGAPTPRPSFGWARRAVAVCCLGMAIALAWGGFGPTAGTALARPLQGDAPEHASEAEEARFLTGTRRVTFEGSRAGEGYFSTDGNWMVFQSEREEGNPFYQIYLMDLETGDTTRVSPGQGKTTCAWIHPDKSKILFASTHEDPDIEEKQRQEYEDRRSPTRKYEWSYDEFFDIYTASPEGEDLVNLTRVRGYDAEGSFSPDGEWIAFSSNRHAYSEELSEQDAERFAIDKSYLLDIYIMRSDGSDVRRLTEAKGYDGGPFFSPDGKRICWRRFDEKGLTAEIYTMNIDGSDKKQLTSIGAMSWAPYYHPSGEYLIFTTNRHGFTNFELYLIDAEGKSEPVRVTYTNGFDGLPVFTPDGKRLAFTSSRGGTKGQIFFADWNHQEARTRLGLSQPSPTRTRDAIDATDLEAHVSYLASAELEGRATGSRGERLAAQYIARHFEHLGLAPAGSDGFFHDFPFTAGLELGSSNGLSVSGATIETDLTQTGTTWQPIPFSKTGTVEKSGIVFGGYGIVAPPGPGLPEGYDSLAGLEVRDRWVMVFRYAPRDLPDEQRLHLERHANLPFKAIYLREKGARGMIVVSGPRSEVRSELVPLRYEATNDSNALPAISITDALASELLASSGHSLDKLQAQLDEGLSVTGFEVPGVALSATIDLSKERGRGRNVLGRLQTGRTPKPTAVYVGAHYDHLGHGEGGSSRAHADEVGGIHYGADDNASGVAGMLEMAQWLASLARSGKLELQHDIVFAAWSGEELGLLGSTSYVEKLAGDTSSINPPVVAYLNLDMIGRLRDTLRLQGVGSSPDWLAEIERRNAPVGVPITPDEACFLPTDSTPFFLRGVPILAAFTGSHADYHTPRDTVDRLDFDGMTKISRLMALIARGLATQDAIAFTKPKEAKQPDRPRGRVWLGTIPAYGGSDVPGVKLEGAVEGGPAEEAGVKPGDIIVELGDTKTGTIYEFMHAMGQLVVGEPTRLVVLRDGERVELTITPRSRE